MPSGAFQMTGHVDGPSVELVPAEWLVRPDHYVTVGLTGELDKGERELRGVVDTPLSGCTTFTVHPVLPAR